MKFICSYRNQQGVTAWRETHSNPNVFNLRDAFEYGIKLADAFNATLRLGELPRMCVQAIGVMPDPEPPHTWRKTNLVTIAKGNAYFDTLECEVCGARARRYGLSNIVLTPDPNSNKKTPSSYMKKYRHCTPEEHPVDNYDDVTDWQHTTEAGAPTRKGLYQTTAEPQPGKPVLWRLFDGQIRWGPADANPRRAVERAQSEGMLLTAPLYWRGLAHDPAEQAAEPRARVALIAAPTTPADEEVPVQLRAHLVKKGTKPRKGDHWEDDEGGQWYYDGKAWRFPEEGDTILIGGKDLYVWRGVQPEGGDWHRKEKVWRTLLLDHEAVDRAFAGNAQQMQLVMPVTRRVALVSQ